MVVTHTTDISFRCALSPLHWFASTPPHLPIRLDQIFIQRLTAFDNGDHDRRNTVVLLA